MLFSSCGVAYEQQRAEVLKTASSESFGPPPPADYRSIGEAFIRRVLKDPESAKFEWVGEPKHEAIQPAFASPHATPVWVTGVRVNAKNSFGGYTGFDPFALAWKNGKIVAYTSTETGGFWQYRWHRVTANLMPSSHVYEIRPCEDKRRVPTAELGEARGATHWQWIAFVGGHSINPSYVRDPGAIREFVKVALSVSVSVLSSKRNGKDKSASTTI